jgi:hypothetical protein
LSHIVADFRQIIWRKFLRSLCKYNTMAQKVLPHNVAWPFSDFLPSCCRYLFAARICGRKGQLAPAVAPMLKKRVLPDNVAQQIFFSELTRKPFAKCLWEVSPYYASETAAARRENRDICVRIVLVNSLCSIALTSRNHARYHGT